MTSKKGIPPTLEAFLEAVRGTPYEEIFRDEASADRALADALRASSDPTAREIGDGLLDGSLTVHEMARSSVYEEFMHNGLASLNHAGINNIFAGIAAEDEVVNSAVPHDHDIEGDEDGDGELWRSFRA